MDVRRIGNFRRLNSILTGKINMYCALMVTNFALVDSSFRLHKHPIGLQMEKLCLALVSSMAHYYYPKSVQEGRCFQQEVITVQNPGGLLLFPYLFLFLNHAPLKQTFSPKPHHQNKTLNRRH